MPTRPGDATPRVAVVAEKPSVARDIASVLGARKRTAGYLYGNGYVVTWAIGHLVALAEPHQIDTAWKSWRRELLPMLPAEWPLIVNDGTADQFAIVQKILRSNHIEEVICATDAGREGELIFRYIYEATHCTKPVRRLWISSLTADAIAKGFDRLRAGRTLDPLADAARGRSRADWLVGMNLSRAFTLAHDEQLTIGRVQTPTLAMVVERELAIRNFVPEDYYEVTAKFAPTPTHRDDAAYDGTRFAGERPTSEAKRLNGDGIEAEQIVRRVRTGAASVESVKDETKRLAPPLLYDLTELQRHANRLFGFSAKKTLTVAQQLYEQKKLISYPRTDSRHLSGDVAATLPDVVDAIRRPYESLLAPGTGTTPLSRRFVDDTQVTDHHAIIPTTTPSSGLSLSDDERRLYDLICRRLLSAWHGDHVWSIRTVITAVTSGAVAARIVDRFHSTGNSVLEQGWKVLDIAPRSPSKARVPTSVKAGESVNVGDVEGSDRKLPGVLRRDLDVAVLSAKAVAKKTKPPPRHTEATLLTAMETAGRGLDDKELAAAMRDCGLGTPATRAEIIENLLRREYMERTGKTLAATDKGIHLIELVHPQVKSPALTGEWESQLARIERGEDSLANFMTRIEEFVRTMVDGAFAARSTADRVTTPSTTDLAGRESDAQQTQRSETAQHTQTTQRTQATQRSDVAPHTNHTVHTNEPTSQLTAATHTPAATRPQLRADDLANLLRTTFRLNAFRPHQEDVCRAALRGEDVLLVMPTGAGKSLCYQLPGLARGGTTLVISPLIALMEDQVAKLTALGLRADRIHSGRDRSTLRQVCRDYLDSNLDYLFIAPERLSVAGFPEMLAKRKPSLIAIDEAHCISAWGHDFRPDYRLIGGHLPQFRPTPVVATTATATPLVQDDIATQLGLARAGRHIHGFRRDNIAVEVTELAPSHRSDAVRRILGDESRRPAIVYAPTRKEADRLALELRDELKVAAYHAGMSASARDKVQTRFLSSQLDAIVATIAFGMGIDKSDIRTVIHTALPGSLESYYQEIGRAGRDGKPSRAILLYSWADRKTHEFFYNRDYPDIGVLEQIYSRLERESQTVYGLQDRFPFEADQFQKGLEKLWISGGADVTPDEQVTRGHDRWRDPYRAQCAHKLKQLEDISRFAETSTCRMLQLVRHFGDQHDSGRVCEMCDVCHPNSCEVQSFQRPTPDQQTALYRTLQALRERDNQTTGQLFREVCEIDGLLERRTYERCLGGLVRAGLLDLEEDSFTKDGRRIVFQRAALTHDGAFADVVAAVATIVVVAEPPTRAKASRGRRTKQTRKTKTSSSRPGRPSRETLHPLATLEFEPSPHIVAALKSWRLDLARQNKVPAFTIMTDRTLQSIAAARPADIDELLQIRGVGPKVVKQHGTAILRVLAT